MNNPERYESALASLKILGEQAVVDITKDDFDFITRSKLFLADVRGRVRQVLEGIAYGAVDIIGQPRFPLPAEYVAAVIAMFSHPANYTVCCNIMAGAEYTDNIVTGIQEEIKAEQLFAMIIEIKAGHNDLIEKKRLKLKAVAESQSITTNE